MAVVVYNDMTVLVVKYMIVQFVPIFPLFPLYHNISYIIVMGEPSKRASSTLNTHFDKETIVFGNDNVLSSDITIC
jgi:hypothetical protein